MDSPDVDTPQPLTLAVQALEQARAGEWNIAYYTIEALLDHGPAGAHTALWLWAGHLEDTLTPPGQKLDVKKVTYGTVAGDPVPAEQLDRATAWAARLLAARLAGDDLAYDATLLEYPADPVGQYNRLLAALACVVRTEQHPNPVRPTNP